MAIPNEAKRKRMSAIRSPETQAQLQAYQGAPAPSTPVVAKTTGVVTGEAKRQAMSAIASVETLAHIGALKITGGIALYAARIREADRQAGTTPRQVKREQVGREYVR